MNQNSLLAFHESEKNTGESRRVAVYQYMLAQGEYGATDDEIINMMGVKKHTNSQRGTRLQLMRLGAVIKTDNRRFTEAGYLADVYIAVPGVDVRKAPPKTERDHMETAARKKIKEMSDDELRDFVRSDSDEAVGGDDFFDLFGE